MRKTAYLFIMMGVILVAGLILLVQGAVRDVPLETTTINVGVLLPLTGDFASVSEGYMKGIQDAQSENIKFIYEDSACDPVKAVNAFKKLTEINNVDYIIGPACGSPQEAIAPLAQQTDTLVILPVAASGKLYEQSGGNMFQLQYSLEDESRFVAEAMNEKGYKTVVLLTYGNAFSQTHSASFKKHFTGTIKEFKITDLNSDINTEVFQISELQPDAIYSPDLSFFIVNGLQKLEQFNVDAPVYLVYTAQFPPVREFVEGVIYSYPGDIGHEEGAQYGLGKQAAELFSEAVASCADDVACVHEVLLTSGVFTDNGISNRPVILKQIIDGKPVNI